MTVSDMHFGIGEILKERIADALKLEIMFNKAAPYILRFGQVKENFSATKRIVRRLSDSSGGLNNRKYDIY